MVKTTEGWHTVDDGVKLFTKRWELCTASPLQFYLVTGQGNMYKEFFELLAARNIEVCSFDQRGNGRTATTKMSEGRSGPTRRVITDVQSIISPHLPSKIPIFLCGHSMGGTTIFTYACTGPYDQIAQIRGFMGESPDFGFPDGAPAKPSWIERQLLNALIRIYPSVQMKRPLDPTILSPDVAVEKQYLSDSHHTFTVEGLMGHFDRVKKLVSHVVKFSSDVRSIWIGHGTMDLCTDYDATKKWLQEIDIEDKELRTYEGCLNNLHTEIPEVRERFATDVAYWILSRID